jgi:hypothetical protein
METTETKQDYADRTLILRIIGVILFIVGGIAAFLGPVEMYCFYLFSEGGRFQYEGFRFGSFMFGNLAAQITGYYFIAGLLLPFGYAQLMLRRWTVTLALALRQFWIVAGLPLVVATFAVLVSSKETSIFAAIGAMILLAGAYLLLPSLMKRFYQNESTRRTLEAHDPSNTWLDELPIPVLGLSILYAFFILVLHTLIYFNGSFPLFGTWLTGLAGITALDILILCMIVLIWGTLRIGRWAWWGALLYFSLITISWMLTLATTTWMDFLTLLNFPAYEITFLQGIPIHGAHLAVLSGIPLALTLVSIAHAAPSFRIITESEP